MCLLNVFSLISLIKIEKNIKFKSNNYFLFFSMYWSACLGKTWYMPCRLKCYCFNLDTSIVMNGILLVTKQICVTESIVTPLAR